MGKNKNFETYSFFIGKREGNILDVMGIDFGNKIILCEYKINCRRWNHVLTPVAVKKGTRRTSKTGHYACFEWVPLTERDFYDLRMKKRNSPQGSLAKHLKFPDESRKGLVF